MLISPRAGGGSLSDVGTASGRARVQRVGRVRRRPRRARALARLARPLGASALALLLLAGAVLAWRWAVATPRFAVAHVEVRGASRVPVDQILAAARIAPGTSLLRLDLAAVAARVEALPEIRHARVVRELPDHVTVYVEERRPFTLVNAGRLHWVDEEGRALGVEREAVALQVPAITGLSEDELETMRTAPSGKAQTAIGLIRTLLRSRSPLTEEISEIDMSRRDGPVLYTVDGVEVRLGTEDWEERLARLEGVLAQLGLENGGVSTVDLRFRDQVVLQKRGAR
jgi:cell division septal protein FtsQ